MVTSLTKFLELPNFENMTIFTIQFETRYKTLLVMSWTKSMKS